MNGFFLIKDNLANKISYYHLLLLMASLPFNMFYSHLILASLAIHTLIHFDKNAIRPVFTWRTIVLQSVFLITVFSTLYSINRTEAFNEWGKHLSILVFPLLLCLNPLEIKKYREQLLMGFAIVCTATIAYLFMDALVTVKHYNLPLSALFSPAFTNHNFSEPLDIHATFFSMQIAISLVYLLSVLAREIVFYKKLFYLVCCLVLTAGIMQLSSKSIFMIMVIVINIALPWFLLKGAKRWRFIAVSTTMSALLFAVILNTNTFKERYVDELKTDLTKTNTNETTDSRVARWGIALELAGKSPLIGYGAGSEIGLLHEEFYNHKLYNSYLNGLNAHSQYLSFLLKSGIVGLLLYLATLAFGFRIAFRQNDLLFLTFMALIAIVSLSENLLDVDKGTIFYAFFFSFFVFSNEDMANGSRLAKKQIPMPGKKKQIADEKMDLRVPV
jgi:O-antigen ligase